MADSPRVQVTQVLKAVEEGDPRAAERLLPLVYAELRALARSLMAKTPPGNTFQPTALVHEAFIRIVGNEDPGCYCDRRRLTTRARLELFRSSFRSSW